MNNFNEQLNKTRIFHPRDYVMNPHKNGNVEVWDACPGTGKSTLLFNTLKNLLSADKNNCVLIIVVSLDEIDRFTKELSDFNFVTPEKDELFLTKKDSLENLLESKQNIVATQELFNRFDFDTYSKLSNYILIFDEEVNMIKSTGLPIDLVRLLLDNGMLELDNETHELLISNNETKYEVEKSGYDIKKIHNILKKRNIFCGISNIIESENIHDKINSVIKEKNIQIFKQPKKIIILSFMFKTSIMYHYLKGNNIIVNFAKLPELQDRQTEILQNLKNLINIDEEMLLLKGEKFVRADSKIIAKKLKHKSILSVSSIINNYFTKDNIKKITGLLYTYCNKNNYKTKNTIFVCWKDMYTRGVIKSGKFKRKQGILIKGFKDNFVASNTKATNNYADRENIIIAKNIFLSPNLKYYFSSKYNIKLKDDDFALSEMMQVIFRLRIRNGEKINALILPERLRNLLKDYINSF